MQMIIKIDSRETSLLQLIHKLVGETPMFKDLAIKSESLPLGDIILSYDTEDKIIIERKSISDLLSSIKDGRYEEQSYRLNGLNHHNHNIIYLVEGTIKADKSTAYSAMFSLNYFKGFSVFRSFNLEESALIICNMAYKLNKEMQNKKPFYTNINLNTSDENTETSEKNYVNVIKKVKKENITPDNIGEIMLCQIPGISSTTALVIMEKYKSLPNLIQEIEKNKDCLKDILSSNGRKINKTSLLNIVTFLVKK
jgi:crossover junction endonuclease MUS81